MEPNRPKEMGSENPGREEATAEARRGAPARRTGRTRAILIAAAVSAALATAGCLWFHRLLNGPVARGDFSATVVITRGRPYRLIVEDLRSAGLLPHPFVFDYLAWRRGDAGHLRPGRYKLRSSMSARQIYEALIRGAPVRITVPEGRTIQQIAARLAREGLVEKADLFTSAAKDAAFLARHSIPGPSAEGYILPETYLFDPGTGTGEILEKMVRAFERRYADLAQTSAPLGLDWHKVLTLASMIEREARTEAEKPLIASVYYNRLRRGMALECDATVRYALDKWRGPLTREDLRVNSPYNTYVNKGLPPGPICCVGRSSIEAALSPARTAYLYYCYKPGDGHYFSKTFREHQRAVKKYLRKDLTRHRKGE